MATNDDVPGAFEWSLSCRIVNRPRLAEDGVHTPRDGDQAFGNWKQGYGYEWKLVEAQLAFHGETIGLIKQIDRQTHLRYVVFNSGLRTPFINSIMNLDYGMRPNDGQCKASARLFFSRRFERLSSSAQVGILLTAYRLDRLATARFALWPKLYPDKTMEARVDESVRMEHEIVRNAEQRYGFKWEADAFLPKGEFPTADDSVLEKHLEPGEAGREIEGFKS